MGRRRCDPNFLGSHTILDTSGLDIDDLNLEGRWLEFSTTSRQIEALRITVDTNANDEGVFVDTSVGVRPCRVRAVSLWALAWPDLEDEGKQGGVTIGGDARARCGSSQCSRGVSPRLNCERQAVLLRRSRARGEGCERTRWIDTSVEIDGDSSIIIRSETERNRPPP